MRLWSIHPKYLDASGLVACWREGLLARKVLLGQTTGYRNHPQLLRFKTSPNPIQVIDNYLYEIYNEAVKRNYNFDRNKFGKVNTILKINVTEGQLHYEFTHLLNKLKERNVNLYKNLINLKTVEPHPVFTVIKGGIESWEKI